MYKKFWTKGKKLEVDSDLWERICDKVIEVDNVTDELKSLMLELERRNDEELCLEEEAQEVSPW